MRFLTLILALLIFTSTAYASVIPQAMKWKYGANCSDNKEGDDIGVWESNTARPGKAQVAIDVQEYNTYIAGVNAKEAAIAVEESTLRAKLVDRAVQDLKKDGVTLIYEDELVKRYKEKKK